MKYSGGGNQRVKGGRRYGRRRVAVTGHDPL